MSSSEWKSYKLEDLCKSISVTHRFDKKQLVFLNTGDIERGKFLHHNYSGVDTMPGQAKKTIRKNDILFSEIRPANGRYALVDFDADDYVVSTKLMVIRANKEILPKYLYFFLTSNQTTSWLQHLAESRSGTFPQITFDHIRELDILLPPKSEQEKIISFLSALDEKIELNRQTNATLEAIAQAIFKEWFVDFNFPGAPSTGSGGELVESELGMIPSGWRVGNFLEIASLLSGGTPNTQISDYWDGQIKWVSAKDVSAAQGTFVLDTERKITPLGLKNSSAKILSEMTTIVTARGTVGSYCILSEPMAMNQTNYGLKAKAAKTDYYVFFSLANLVTHLRQVSYGTIFDTVTTKTFEQARIAIPPVQIRENFDQQVSPIMQKILVNIQESATLAAIRDALLPKLMNGEIEI